MVAALHLPFLSSLEYRLVPLVPSIALVSTVGRPRTVLLIPILVAYNVIHGKLQGLFVQRR